MFPSSNAVNSTDSAPSAAPVPSPYPTDPNMTTAPAPALVTSQVVVTPMLQGQDPAGGVPVPLPKVQVTIINP